MRIILEPEDKAELKALARSLEGLGLARVAENEVSANDINGRVRAGGMLQVSEGSFPYGGNTLEAQDVNRFMEKLISDEAVGAFVMRHYVQPWLRSMEREGRVWAPEMITKAQVWLKQKFKGYLDELPAVDMVSFEKFGKVLRQMEVEGTIKHKYDYTWVLCAVRLERGFPEMFTSTDKYVRFLRGLDLEKVPTRQQIDDHFMKTNGNGVDSLTFDDKDDYQEQQRRRMVARRFLDLMSN